jgi:glycogen operon protein
VRDALGRELRILPGHPLPFGVTETRRGLNFAVFSKHATAVTLVLFGRRRDAPVLELPLDVTTHRTGHVWHAEIAGLDPGTRYGWRAARDGDDAPVHRYDPTAVLIDPYATALTGGSRWGAVEPRDGESHATRWPRRRSLYVGTGFDWDGTRPPRIALEDKVIYELHVRGFTRHASAGVAHPGTFYGLIEKIPYLRDLGVTTVELLPVYEFDELEPRLVDPTTGQRLLNYWGYSPLCFFAPKASYASFGFDGAQVLEFRTMVREFHRAGLEVLLDVVFNHTAEAPLPPGAPPLSLRGLDNAVYYLVDPITGEYLDFSGCGNTLNCNHPVVRNLIIDALRYWVAEMHVDGFRFDLASILGRGQNGEVLANPPVLERIANDPVIADATLIAEAWDAAGLYQVGTFPSFRRWAEWNGPFRDDVRHFVRGDPASPPRWRRGSPAAPISSRTRAVPPRTRSTSSPATTASRSGISSRSTRSTMSPTARTAATATTTTSVGTAAPRVLPTIPPCAHCAHASRATSSPCCSAPRARPCCSPATSSAAPNAATTTPTARTTRSPGSTGR